MSSRRTFPDEGSRLAFSVGADDTLQSMAASQVKVYTDSGATTLANIQTTGGAAISGSVLTVASTSLLPLFLGPDDGTDTLYVQKSDGTGPISPVYARVDDRVDLLVGVTGVDAGSYGVSSASSNNTTALLAAIAAAPAGSVIRLPQGTLFIDQISETSKTFTLRGHGPEKTILYGRIGSSSPLLNLDYASATTGVELRDLSFDMNNVRTNVCCYINNASDLFISNVKFRRGTPGLKLGNCDNTLVERFQAINCVTGVQVGSSGLPNAVFRDGWISLSDSSVSMDSGIELTNTLAAGLTFDNIQVIIPTSGGYTCNYGFKMNYASAPSGLQGHFLFFTNCQTDGITGGPGLYLRNIRGVWAANNFFGSLPAATQPGVVIDGGKEMQFSNNWLSGSGVEFRGTDAAPDKLAFSNNIFPITSGSYAFTLPVTNQPTNLALGPNYIFPGGGRDLTNDYAGLNAGSPAPFMDAQGLRVLTSDASTAQTLNLAYAGATLKQRRIRVTSAGILQILNDAADTVEWSVSDAGATTQLGNLTIGSGTTSVSVNKGSGSPEGSLTARVGSLYLRTDGGSSTTLYVKESGTGNTGWRAV